MRGQNVNLRGVFQEERGKLIARVEGRLAKAGYRTDLSTDEEHGLWEIEITMPSGTKVVVDWELASDLELAGRLSDMDCGATQF